jgi:predicted nucleic acid-binding protein
MKILIDSNVILEFILQREEYAVANHLMKTLYKNRDDLFLTTGCFYGMLFTIDKYLRKELNLSNPVRTNILRSIMAKVLSLMDVAGHDKDSLLRGISDNKFMDLEDSCQYQAAVKASCDYLISFNLKDYTDGALMKTMTPQQFLDSYIVK